MRIHNTRQNKTKRVKVVLKRQSERTYQILNFETKNIGFFLILN